MSWIDRQMLRIPEPWALRWGLRVSRAMAITAGLYFVAWWGFGLAAWARVHLPMPLVIMLSIAWAPLAVVMMFFQAVLMAHFTAQSRPLIQRLADADGQMQAALRRLHALYAEGLRRGIPLPDVDDAPAPPKAH